jgi:hypothetical protein
VRGFSPHSRGQETRAEAPRYPKPSSPLLGNFQ